MEEQETKQKVEKRTLQILVYPEESLRIPSVEVTDFDQNLYTLLDEMLNTVVAYDGHGLAAPQVSKNIRVAVIKHDNVVYEMINPIIKEQSGKCSAVEGCLSIPGYSEHIERAKSIKVTYKNRSGEDLELFATEDLARVIQHEVDHLDGILYIDRMSNLKKNLFKTWITKKFKEAERYRRAMIRYAKKNPKKLESIPESATEEYKPIEPFVLPVSGDPTA